MPKLNRPPTTVQSIRRRDPRQTFSRLGEDATFRGVVPQGQRLR